MSVSVLFIGDPHIQISNLQEVDLFMERIINLATEKQPNLIVIAGDLLHDHERIHTTALNKAYELVNNMRLIAKTYILVGNHDYMSNQQFLTDYHWMNGMKEWKNTIVVDTIITEIIEGQKFVFVPYVSPGRFEEALNTSPEKWNDAACIFAHQEFSGCKMGAIISVEGDKWSLDNPYVVSGHIHSKQSPQENIYYSGAALQHAFGESDKNIIAYFIFKNDNYTKEEIDLGLPRKKIVYMDVEDIDNYQVPDTADQIKVTLNGNYDQFKALKKTKTYKNLVDKGLKVVFKPKKVKKRVQEGKEEVKQEEHSHEGANFSNILGQIITEQRNPYLMQSYELVVNGKDMKLDDIMFLN